MEGGKAEEEAPAAESKSTPTPEESKSTPAAAEESKSTPAAAEEAKAGTGGGEGGTSATGAAVEAGSGGGGSGSGKMEEEDEGGPDEYEIAAGERVASKTTQGITAEWDGAIEVVNGYRILKHLGRGAYAEVRLCKSPSGEFTALKALSRRRLAKQREFHRVNGRMKITTALQKVLQEIELMKTLHHRFVVQLADIMDDEDDCLYLVMEYADAGVAMDWDATSQTFRSFHTGTSHLPERAVRHIVGDVCHALVYLHRRGIIHRDIKPDNVLLRSNGDAVLCDFGVAHTFAPAERAAGLRTKTEGTLAFHAPECCTAVDPDADDDAPPPKPTPFNAYKVDIWALGVTMFACLFGQLPFPNATVLELCDSILNDDPFARVPSSIEVSPACMDFLRGLLNRDPEARLSPRQALKHPWLAGYDSDDRVRFKPVDIDKMKPPAALFLAPRIGHMSELVTTESLRHVGWLQKRGRIFSTWRKRYFELNGTDLTYHDKPEGAVKGEVDCAMLQAVTHAPKSSKPFRFFIKAGKRDLYMQAASQEDMGGWMKAFNTIITANAARAAHAKK